MKKPFLLAAAGMMSVTASLSHAATVVVDQTIDIEAVDLNSYSGASYTALDSAVTISTGDTVDMTVNFANNKAIRLDRTSNNTGGFTFWLRTASPYSSWSIANVVIELFGLNTNGDWSNGANLGGENNGSDHLGWLASGAENGLDNGEFLEFSGYRITYQVSALNAGTSTYENIQTSTWGGGGSVVEATVVPLPAALPLLLVALGGLGIAGRRRKAA